MSDAAKHDSIDALRKANPVSADELRADMSPEQHRAALRRAIEAGETGRDLAEDVRVPGSRRGVLGTVRSRPGTTFGLGAALACAGIAAIALLLGGGSAGPGNRPAFAAGAVEVAETNPRVLVGAPGWTVTRADEFEPDHGSMEFSDGENRLTLDWTRVPADYPVPEFSGPQAYLPELDQWYRIPIACAGGKGVIDCRVFERNTEISVLGRPAILAEHQTVRPGRSTTNSFTVYPSPEGRTHLTIYANLVSREQLLDVLDSLYRTDVESWLAALPPRVVEPLERPEVVDEMLEGVPIPASVDVDELKNEASAATRYQLGAAVTGAVACGWLDQWAGAVESGDAATAEEAVAAMSTSREWAILEEMNEQGGWSQTVWEYAREMRRDDRQALLGTAGTETLPDGRVYELSPSYATGLGCESEQRTLREERAQVPPRSFPKPIPVTRPG
jgi:hypothetical protein